MGSPGPRFFDKVNTENGGNRYATVLMYLADVEEGGETVGDRMMCRAHMIHVIVICHRYMPSHWNGSGGLGFSCAGCNAGGVLVLVFGLLIFPQGAGCWRVWVIENVVSIATHINQLLGMLVLKTPCRRTWWAHSKQESGHSSILACNAQSAPCTEARAHGAICWQAGTHTSTA